MPEADPPREPILDATELERFINPAATPEYEERIAELMDGIVPLASLLQPASPVSPALPPQNEERPAVLALLRVFTNGIVDQRIQQAAQILADDLNHQPLTNTTELARLVENR